MELPSSLRAEIDALLEKTTLGPLRRLAAEQSDFYRFQDPEGYRQPLIDSEQAALAYAAWRLPATFASAHDALLSAAACLPDQAPVSMLDLGSGPGTAMWAASAIWPSLSSFVLLEQSSPFIEVGKRLASSAPAALAGARWCHRVATDAPVREVFDLVTVCNLLGELTSDERSRVIEDAWEATSGLLIAVEPGTTRGFERIIDARSMLISRGAHIVAPCPGAGPCPMARPDWCHFSTRVPRSKSHRVVKGGTLGYEDERYSYVAASRTPRSVSGNRLIHSPRVTKGHVLLDVCTGEEIAEVRVPRRDKPKYKRAKKARWGDLLEELEEKHGA